MECALSYVVDHAGIETKGSNLAIDDGSGTMHFLVTQRKQPNYLAHAHDPITRVTDPVPIIRQHTEHTTQYYAKVNLSLAADSPSLAEHGGYIKQLRASIARCPRGILTYDVLYRGVDMSQLELDRMEGLGTFFVPSFTSTSVERTKAYQKSALLVIRACHTSNLACVLTQELSNYYKEEKEVLLACYSALHLERLEKVGKTNVVSLYLDDFLSSLAQI